MLSLITNIKELSLIRKELKDRFGVVKTNFTALPLETNTWIEGKKLLFITAHETIFLIKKGERVNELFFFGKDMPTIEKDLKDSLNKFPATPTIMEILTKNKEEDFTEEPLMVLQRMSSVIIPEVSEEKLEGVKKTTLKDAEVIEQILLNNFNPITERIPTLKEIEDLIINHSEGGINLIKEVSEKEDEKIIGLMIYSLTPSTIHLRYWWSHPQYRGAKVGSRLLNSFFDVGKDCKRMILWVDVKNENAISKYIHYGFSKESMYDQIYRLK